LAPAFIHVWPLKSLRLSETISAQSLEHEREKRIEEIKQVMQQSSLSAELEVVVEKDILAGILKHAADTDLVLMGGRTGDFFELLLSRSLTEDITEKVKCPVVWVREYEESRSLWNRILKPTKTEKV
jgi:nucleotide-binding universal stress UspA family protein